MYYSEDEEEYPSLQEELREHTSHVTYDLNQRVLPDLTAIILDYTAIWQEYGFISTNSGEDED